METKNIEVNGHQISYCQQGNGKTIVFLHGWGQNKECFNYFYEQLKADYEVIGIDLPGFGTSDEPNREFDIYDYANIVSEFLEKLKIQHPIVVAHSFGVRISIILAANKLLDNKLIFTGGAGIKPKRTLKYKTSVLNYKFMKFLTTTPFYKHYRDDLLSTSGSQDYKDASPIMKSVLSKVVNEDLESYLVNIDNETLLYWGSADDATPLSDGIKMNDEITNSKLIVRENEGHYSFLESKEIFLQELKDFIK